MKLLEIKDKKILQNFLTTAAASSGAEFLVSIEWAQIIKNKEIVETFGVYDDEKLIAAFNLIKKDFSFGLFYYYLPRGPVFDANLSEAKLIQVWQFLILELKKYNGIFLRVEPKNSLPSIIKAQPTINLQPQETLMLNLSLSEEELLSSCHQKTRYNINLARKKEVEIICDNSLIGDFWRLMTKTGLRDNFKIHNKKHYELLAKANSDFIKLFVAKKDDEVIAAGLFSFYGKRVTYLHGASDYNSRQLMAPYLLQWTVILEAKKLAYKYYDFYGIDELKWPGVTRFKLGFGGFKVRYFGTKDVILKPFFYYLYNMLRRLRRLI